MLLSSSVTKLEGDGVVILGDLEVVVVVVVVVVVNVLAVVELIVLVVGGLVVPFFNSFVTSLDEIPMELGGRDTTVASVLS